MIVRNDVLTGLTVLIVEDEYLIATDLQRVVEDAGAERVLLARSTASAVGFLHASHRIDACILDLKLGDEDGRPLAQELLKRGIPFVVATGMGVDVDLDLADLVMVQKPYSDAQVVEALNLARRSRETPSKA